MKDVALEWRYVGPFNFYRRMYRQLSLNELKRGDPFSPGRSAYVLYFPGEQEFVKANDLDVIYRNESYGTAIAVPKGSCAAAEHLM